MNRFNLFLLAFGLLTLSACTTNPFNLDAYSKIHALSYYQWVLEAEAESLQEEKTRLVALQDNDPSPERLVQYAILLSARSEGGAQSDVEAIALLDSIEFTALPPEYQTFSTLWKQVLNARTLARTNQELVQALEKERITLQSQIDALTSIEQQLNNREELRDL